MTCGEWLVRLLEEHGIDLVFGIPGVHTIELYRGLSQSRIRHIGPRHEQGAGFMADGYARAGGRPGVCFCISGPGMTNILTPMAQAYGDSIPMLVVSSVNRTDHLGRGGGRLHELRSQRDLVAGVAAFSHTLTHPGDLPDLLGQAFTVFRSRRPRPVHIEIPVDVLETTVEPGGTGHAEIAPAPAPDPAAIRSAVDLLLASRRPVVLLGGGARDAGQATIALVEALDAPFACTINAKGLVPDRHPLSLGSTQSLSPVRDLVRQSDVVLAIGTELGETDYDVVFDGQFRIEGRLIRVDIDGEQLSRNFPADVGIVGDASAVMRGILDELATRAVSPRETRGVQRAAAVRELLEAGRPAIWRAYQRLFDTIQRALPNAIIVGDSTQPVYVGNHLFDADRPRSWFNSSTGFGTLGYALPAAIGARLAAPERPVIALIGDGGLSFTLPELSSAVEAGTPIIVLLWNNRGYAEIRRSMLAHAVRPIGVEPHTPDFLALATAFGCLGERASSPEHLHRLLTDASRAEVPTVIELPEDVVLSW